MAGHFPIYTDEDVNGRLVAGLVRRGWDVLRAIDTYPEGTHDDVHFAAAAERGRVLVANDLDQLLNANRWIEEDRPFAGFITWDQELHLRYSIGPFLAAFEELAARDEPFAGNRIIFLQPRG